jgi:hypothetical protein
VSSPNIFDSDAPLEELWKKYLETVGGLELDDEHLRSHRVGFFIGARFMYMAIRINEHKANKL